MIGPVIKFKGIQEGLLIIVEGSDIKLIKEELDKKISETSKFYQGIKFLGIESKSLTNDEILDLNLMLKYKYDFDITLKNSFKDLLYPTIEKDHKVKEDPLESSLESSLEEFKGEKAKFIHGTLRSGQEIDYDGHVVVVGDVNPGAFIKASGNVVIMGILRGVVYAGLGGDESSIIAAYKLIASQLRIGNVIGRAPDEKESHYNVPEIVRLVDGKLVIEPYLPNR